MWVSENKGVFTIKAMFGNRSDIVSKTEYKNRYEAIGQLMRWHYGIDKKPACIA